MGSYKITVYKDNILEVEKRLKSIDRKAQKYGKVFSYSIGEEYPKEISIREVDPVTQTIGTVDTMMVSAVDITIEDEGLIRKDGWTVLAKIEHENEGNIVTVFGDLKAPVEWYKLEPKCDHCMTNRARKVTYICQQDSGIVRQVGKGCLKDYTGISPASAALFAEVRDIVNNGFSIEHNSWNAMGVRPLLSVAEIIAQASDEIRRKGYTKSGEPNSTKDAVKENLRNMRIASKKGYSEADAICKWLENMDYDSAGDLINNCISLAKNRYTDYSNIGRLCYMPIAYQRHLLKEKEKKQKERDSEKLKNTSKYIGNVGKKVNFTVYSCALVSSFDGVYGTIFVYKFIDTEGNRLVWFASKPKEYHEGDKISGYVKRHKEYEGVKETVLGRCRKVK